ncbi:hypothetical protein ACFL2H_07945 [Planctomycetota bacterium]
MLPISLAKYLELLDWTGRQIRTKKRGAIPGDLAPILERLRLDTLIWCDLVQKFGKLFKRAVGTAESLATEAARRGQSFMHAPGGIDADCRQRLSDGLQIISQIAKPPDVFSLARVLPGHSARRRPRIREFLRAELWLSLIDRLTLSTG